MSHITMDKLTSTTCRWPSGDPKMQDFNFCGNACQAHLSYCAVHMDVAYNHAAYRRTQIKQKTAA